MAPLQMGTAAPPLRAPQRLEALPEFTVRVLSPTSLQPFPLRPAALKAPAEPPTPDTPEAARPDN